MTDPLIITTSPPDSGFLANSDLPPREDIVALCEKAGHQCRGIPLLNLAGEPIAWIKYGPDVFIDEARTQDWVAKRLEATQVDGTVRAPRVYDYFSVIGPGDWWPMRYIITEYINAPNCTSKDTKLVARAVQALIGVRGPSDAPGHVGGGPIVHTFYIDERTSPFRYKNVAELEQHINGILRVREDPRRVNLVAKVSDGLFLCPCDILPRNFKKLADDKVAVVDFRASCFLPPSFFALAMAKANDDVFTVRVARRVDYPKSDDVAAMKAASYFLVPFGRNDIGAPKYLRQRAKELKSLAEASTVGITAGNALG